MPNKEEYPSGFRELFERSRKLKKETERLKVESDRLAAEIERIAEEARAQRGKGRLKPKE
jgi:hypothetical protein